MGSRLFRLGLIVGRFQPLHVGHGEMLDRALELCDEVLVFVGSSQESGTVNNPFTYELRRDMIRAVYGDRLLVSPLPDIGVGNNASWGKYVLDSAAARAGFLPDLFISGTEARRLSWFSGIEGVSMPALTVPKRIEISAAALRAMIAEDRFDEWKAFADPAIHEMYPVLRGAVLAANGGTHTASL